MKDQPVFAIWLTGLPASGKSSITQKLAALLRGEDLPVVVLESDEMRTILTPEPTYTEQERDRFYRQMVQLGEMISRSNVNVIFDATANKRIYRESARSLIPRFMEIYIDCPLEICKKRDPKGIYAKAASQIALNVPGLQTAYEKPISPELTVNGQDDPGKNAVKIWEDLKRRFYL